MSRFFRKSSGKAPPSLQRVLADVCALHLALLYRWETYLEDAPPQCCKVDWREGLNAPSAIGMKHLKALLASRGWEKMQPER
jgi:hypothetical protein